MKIYCTPEFKKEYEKLIAHKSYRDIQQEIIRLYFNKQLNDCLSGTRLNGNSPNPFIKKRIGGSGGNRIYLLIVSKKDSLYFSFIHPKTGSYGSENISDTKIAELLDTVYECIKSDNLYKLNVTEDNKAIEFANVVNTVAASKS